MDMPLDYEMALDGNPAETRKDHPDALAQGARISDGEKKEIPVVMSMGRRSSESFEVFDLT
ncbi:hypothetical protein ACIQD1_27965 [Streptomyces sp. NPDC093088]|uniref:hypothetical protein n=1 Tax=Streptomyces sp. NPDC093088 TaxID=3366023 RepID=UPI00380E6C2E